MIFLLSLILIIILHEGGHFIAAKICKCKVEVFAIGFGKSIWEKKIGETVYKLNWILFGGYCSLKHELSYSRSKYAYTNKRYSQKVFIALAGIGMNLITGGIALLLGKMFFNYYLFIFGFYSIVVGLSNLIPIPALDGSHPLFFLLEFKLGKKRTYQLMTSLFGKCMKWLMILNLLSVPFLIYWLFTGQIS